MPRTGEIQFHIVDDSLRQQQPTPGRAQRFLTALGDRTAWVADDDVSEFTLRKTAARMGLRLGMRRIEQHGRPGRLWWVKPTDGGQ